MTGRRSILGTMVTALSVFAVGTGVGFAWREGWIPMEVVSPPTGEIDHASDDPLDPSSESQRPRNQPAPVLGGSSPTVVAVQALPFPVSDESTPFAVEQSEPQPAPSLEFASTAAPARLQTVPEPAGRGTPIHRGGIQPASFDQATEVPAPRRSTPATTEPPEIGPPSEEASLADCIAEFDRLKDSGAILAAHKLLSQRYWKHRAERGSLAERLDETGEIIFFQPQPHFVEPYVIEPGDRLDSIASQHRLSWEYLANLNHIDPRRIQAGKRLKVARGPFGAVVELDDFSLTVHLQGYYVRRYEVGIGKDGSSPVGKLTVLNKVVNPQYTDPSGRVVPGDDPSNPLGERWIDLGHSYGIHGTIEPDSIGTAASRGCIRLRDADVIEVYNFLVTGSDVVIRR